MEKYNLFALSENVVKILLKLSLLRVSEKGKEEDKSI